VRGTANWLVVRGIAVGEGVGDVGKGGVDRQDLKEVGKGDGVGDVGIVSPVGGELEVVERARLVSPSSSLSSLTSLRLFGAFMVLLAAGRSSGSLWMHWYRG
jgi:hypothetical protein